ncbi:MAG: hypothetical protein RQ724_06975 [Desulfuromonadales bacterium]|nr:hypothetical protein [Desulfuromonadales bacterium]
MIMQLKEILAERRLQSSFQPLVNLKSSEILGYEALVRGPLNSPLHSPESLFAVAAMCGQLDKLEIVCQAVHLKSFVELGLDGLLFLNIAEPRGTLLAIFLFQPLTASTWLSQPSISSPPALPKD